MIIDFSVSNFGSIKDTQTLSFEATKDKTLEDYYVIKVPLKTKKPKNIRLLKLGMLYGANGSGKSTIIKAIDFMRNLVVPPLASKRDSFDYDNFLFGDDDVSSIGVRFVSDGYVFHYNVKFRKQYIVSEELSFDNETIIFRRERDFKTCTYDIVLGECINLTGSLESYSLPNNSLLATCKGICDGVLKSAVDFFSTLVVSNTTTKEEVFNAVLNDIKGSDIDKQSLAAALHSAGFNVDSLRLAGDRLWLSHGGYELEYSKESDGAKNYYLLAGMVAMSGDNSKVLCVDDLDASLHPDVLEHFILNHLKNSKDVQLFFTSHNREVLTDRDMCRNDAIWFADTPDGYSTGLYSLADFPTDTVRKTSSIYNAYKAGRLGATPDIF